ncbi:15275_t:CDS:1, partial [Entrophospora sp. SA101]
TLGMIIGCDKTTKAITQGLTTMVFWGITVMGGYWDYNESEKGIIISTAFINFLNAIR